MVWVLLFCNFVPMSFSVNKVMLMWRATSDVEVKTIQTNNLSVVNFTLATNRSFKNNQWAMVDDSEFHKCTAYGNSADILWKYLTKWKKIFVEGRIKTKKWNDATGSTRWSTEIIIENFIFVDKKNTKKNSQSKSQNDEEEIDHLEEVITNVVDSSYEHEE